MCFGDGAAVDACDDAHLDIFREGHIAMIISGRQLAQALYPLGIARVLIQTSCIDALIC